MYSRRKKKQNKQKTRTTKQINKQKTKQTQKQSLANSQKQLVVKKMSGRQIGCGLIKYWRERNGVWSQKGVGRGKDGLSNFSTVAY